MEVKRLLHPQHLDSNAIGLAADERCETAAPIRVISSSGRSFAIAPET
jgi:hypothetical protein